MNSVVLKKEGMTHVFDENGVRVPVTVMVLVNNVVVDVRSKEKNGYNSVLIGVEGKEKNVSKSMNGYFKKQAVAPCKFLKEIRGEFEGVEVADKIGLDFLAANDLVKVVAESKGKGFQGVMKRYGFGGGPDSHGCSVAHRVPGSIGQGTDPGRVIKGKKMAGHMGAEQKTVKNLKVVGVESEQGMVLVKGAVPGRKGTYVVLSKVA